MGSKFLSCESRLRRFFWLNVFFPAETNTQQQGIIIVIERFYLIYLSWAKALRSVSKIPDFRSLCERIPSGDSLRYYSSKAARHILVLLGRLYACQDLFNANPYLFTTGNFLNLFDRVSPTFI